ncbi:hypothetical protein LAZ67_16000045 [Cordylochernes scorpioides]|uniref:Band 7 domain-containing protein n=1 Tax=Cordylochernes scorpioides TaxID=51811 RepID=A0ABY6LCD2_9ARAC|nr:hypothetical protein LAZ67_16000045 [Cordylochernes scorpioides]
MEEATENWGIRVERVEIKDFKLPEQLQKSMAAEAEASREARAKVIAAEGEQMASRALKEAADVIVESPAALQLRYLQTLRAMSGDGSNTVVVAVPLELAPGGKSVSGATAVASGFLLRKETAA